MNTKIVEHLLYKNKTNNCVKNVANHVSFLIIENYIILVEYIKKKKKCIILDKLKILLNNFG